MKRARCLLFPSILGLAATLGVAHGVLGCAESSAPSDPGVDAGTPSAEASLPETPTCEDGKWCRVALPSEPLAISGIWGAGPSDVWFVANPRSILHWDGATFTTTHLDTRQSIFGIWGSGPSDVWAFSTSRWTWHTRGIDGDDAGWSQSAGTTGLNGIGYPTPLLAMWGTSPSDIWAVGASVTDAEGNGQRPSVLHCDGWRDGEPDWQGSPTGFGDVPDVEQISFNAICGSEKSGIWVVGNGGKVRTTPSGWKGAETEWTPVNSRSSLNLYALWCSPDGDVWAAGDTGTIHRFHRDSADWTLTTTMADTTASIRALWGSAADDVWAVGDAGLALHWDGTTWTPIEAATLGLEANDLYTVWGTGKDDVWIAGRDALLHNGKALSSRLVP